MGIANELREKSQLLRSASEFSCKDFVAIEFGISSPCKSPRRCCDCYADMFERIADRIDEETDRLLDESKKLRGMVRERELPEGIEWPRFEDGEPVRFGDEVEYEDEVGIAACIRFELPGWSMTLNRNLDLSYLSGAFGERVKRPKLRVLDADGVPIEVGDTVYLRSNGRKGEVTEFYEEDGVTWVAVSYELGSDRMTVNTEGKALTHERPDSWEKLEEDAMGRACELAGSGHLKCSDCEWGKEGIGCQAMARLEILKRAKKLAGIEDGGSK